MNVAEHSVSHRKRCRTSKKKRLRLKKRASLEPKVELKTFNPEVSLDHSVNQDKVHNNHETSGINDGGEPQQQQESNLPWKKQNVQNLTPLYQEKYKQSEDKVQDDANEKLMQKEMTEYERKRRENILRNQAFLQHVGVSTAKFAARTSIGNEAEKEKRRNLMAARREIAAARKIELLKHPVRKSKRLEREIASKVKNQLLAGKTSSGRKLRIFVKPKRPEEFEMATFSGNVNTSIILEETKGLKMNPFPLYEEVKDPMIGNHEREESTVLEAKQFEAEKELKPMDSRSALIRQITSRMNQPVDQPSRPSQEGKLESMDVRVLLNLWKQTVKEVPSAIEAQGQADSSDTQEKLAACAAGKQSSETEAGQATNGEEVSIEASCTTQRQEEFEATKSSVQLHHGNLSILTTDIPVQAKNTEVQPQSTKNNVNEQEVMTDYERKRRDNILRNQMFLTQAGISTAKGAARTAIGNEAAKEIKRKELAAKRELQTSQRAELLKRPVRKSRRLSGEKKAAVTEPDSLGYSMDLLSMKTTRQRFTIKVHFMDAIDEEGKIFCQEIIGGIDKRSSLDKELVVNDDVEYTLASEDIVKATPYRINAISFLPRADRVIVACGDKEGHVSLWSPSNGAHSDKDTCSSSAALHRPHGYAVTQLIFPTSSTMISSSMDGRVCEFDLWSSKTSIVCDISYETGITSLAKSENPQFYYASCDDGTLRLIDRRARNVYSSGFKLHKGKINTVDQHPILDHCIATAGRDLKVCFWDKRKISSEGNFPIVQLQHRTERTCAQFSQDDGSWLVTMGCESYIDMYDTSSLFKCKASDILPGYPDPIRIPHNNYTATSTKFRPAWDPKRPNQFVIGCYGQPARLEIYRVGQVQPIHQLVREKCSISDVVTKYHPYLDIIACGNSAGRLSVWRAKK